MASERALSPNTHPTCSQTMTRVIDVERVMHSAIIDPNRDDRYLAGYVRALVDIIRLRLDLKMQPTPARVEVDYQPKSKSGAALPAIDLGPAEPG